MTEDVEVVDISTQKTQDSIASLRKQIAALRDEMLNLAQGSEEYNKKAEQVQEIQDRISSVMRIAKKDIVAVSDSYYALNAKLVELRKAYKGLSEEDRNSEVGRQMIRNIQDLDRQLKIMDADMGQYQRNVGNYTQSILEAGQQMGGSFGGAVTGIRSANNALKLLSTNPVIAILGVLATLLSKIITGLKGSEENANRMSQALSGLKVVGDIITRMLQKLGEWIGKIAEKFGEWLSGIEGVKKAMEDRQKIAQNDIALAKQERDNIKANADAEREVAELRAKAAEKDKYTAKERIAMLERAKELEEGISKRNYELLKEQYEQIKLKNAQTQSSTEALKEEADAYAAMVNAETAYYNKSRELNSQMTRARKEIAAENKKNAEETAKAFMTDTELRTLNLKQRLELAEKGSEEELNIRLLQRAQEYQLEREKLSTSIENEEDRQTALLNAEQIFQQDVLSMQVAFYDEQDRLRQEQIDKEKAEKDAQNKAEEERMAKEYADWVKLQKAKAATLQNSLSTIMSLYETFGDEQAKQSEGYKAVASAQAIVQALLSANEAYASMASIPYVGPALGAVASASALAAGMANVRQIWSTSMRSGGRTASITNPSTPAIVQSPAVIQQVQTTRTLTGVQEEQQAQASQRVYLVYDDVQQAGRKVQVQQAEATF